MDVDEWIFLRGDDETLSREKEIHNTFKEILEANKLSDVDSINIPCSFIASKYLENYANASVFRKQSVGNKMVYVAKVPPEGVKSLVKKQMLAYYAKVGETVKTSVISPSVAKAKAVVSDTLRENAARIVQAGFYTYLFFGVENLMGMNYNLFDGTFPFIPDIVVGTMPFYSMQRLERGMSDRVLKYRAVGDVFLAHQKGSTDTLRVDLTLFGPFRNYYLLYLLSLQQKGESKLKEAKLISSDATSPSEILPADAIKVPKEGKAQYEAHTTFPIITHTAIMLDMFLQTIEWHQQKDRGGQDVIFVHLLFRKYIEPQGYKVYDEKAKQGWLFYGDTETERIRRELVIDSIWKMKEIGKETLGVGLFGGGTRTDIDRQVAENPYFTSIPALIGGFAFEMVNAGLILAMM